MKKFFEEYGKVAIAAIVVVILMVMVKPIGAAIQNGIENIPLPGLTLNASRSGEEGLPQKGDLITIDGKGYRVLELNDTEAKLLAMYDATRMAYNSSSSTTFFYDGKEGQKYENSDVDSYLENTFYPSLSFNEAIIPQNITQNMYEKIDLSNYITVESADASSWGKWNFTASDTLITGSYDYEPYALRKTGSVSVGERHVYLLDVEDVINYLGQDFTPQQLNKMFWNVDHYVESIYPDMMDPYGIAQPASINLRSTEDNSYMGTINILHVYGDSGYITNNYSDDSQAIVRPAFVIDLSKVDWSKQNGSGSNTGSTDKYVISGSVVKGGLITIDDKQYRVLSVNNTEAKVVAMYDATQMEYNNTSEGTPFSKWDDMAGGPLYGGAKYEGSTIDYYLENEFYNSLSFKDAIIPQNLIQNMYTTNEYYGDVEYIYYYDCNSGSYAIGKLDSVFVGERHVYLPDLEEVLEYHNWIYQRGDGSLIHMFWGDYSGSVSSYIWLRSVPEGYGNSYEGWSGTDAYVIDGNGGIITTAYYSTSCVIRPSFVIDLTKFEYTSEI